MLKNRCLLLSLTLVLSFIAVACLFANRRTVAAQDDGNDLTFAVSNRVNVHGDEYMCLALMKDEQNLVVGTERGELIIWNTTSSKAIHRFNQESPIHSLVALDDKHFLAAGGWHNATRRSSVLRRWNVETGTYEDWQSANDSTLLFLTTNESSPVVAGLNAKLNVTVWSKRTGKITNTLRVAGAPDGLTLANGNIYVASTSPIAKAAQLEDDDEQKPSDSSILFYAIEQPSRASRTLVPAKAGRQWATLVASPDGRRLAATYNDDSSNLKIAIIDAASGAETAGFEAKSV